MITITPINVATVTDALMALLKDWPALENVNVLRSEEINETPGECPWVGVYRENVDYPIRTIGFGSGMRDQKISLVIVAQESDGESGQKCEDRLESLLKEIIAAILTDVTIRGSVRVIEDVKVRYEDYRKTGSSYMQTAAVYLTASTVVLAGG